MHICCSNCSLYPLKSLLSKGIDVRGLWFNPNIYPLAEYENRLYSVRQLQDAWGLEVEYAGHYGGEAFIERIGDPDKDRCLLCYAIRLEETAKSAAKMRLDGFTTSLMVSPYQRFDAIVEVGREIGKRQGVPFYMEDFRIGYKDSVLLSKELGLYRQKYCGCVYSEMEAGSRLKRSITTNR